MFVHADSFLSFSKIVTKFMIYPAPTYFFVDILETTFKACAATHFPTWMRWKSSNHALGY